MDEVPLLSIVIQIALILVNAIFACAEIAVLEASEYKIKLLSEKGDKRARILLRFIGENAKFLSTIQVGITLSGFLASAFAAENFAKCLIPLFSWTGFKVATIESICVILVTIILSFFTLIFGELVPKKIAIKNPDEVALKMAKIINIVYTMFSPIVWVLTKTTNGVLKLIGINPNEEDKWEEEDIKMIINESFEDDVFEEDEKELIENIFKFDDLPIKKIMTPRVKCDLIEVNDENFKTKVNQSDHSLVPIYKTTTDNIIGILNVKKFYKTNNKKESITKPVFVKGNMKADILFRKMKKEQLKMVIVIDEFGGTDGVVTINDLTNELISGLKNL